MSNKWEARFMDMARLVATWSKDPDHQVGAVIVDSDRRVRGLGFNGFPRHVVDSPERYADRYVKNHMVVHAEANAILNATKSVADCALYCTRYPCSECAKLIIQSEVSMVVAPLPSPDSRWADDAKFTSAMLQEAMVQHRVPGGSAALDMAVARTRTEEGDA